MLNLSVLKGADVVRGETLGHSQQQQQLQTVQTAEMEAALYRNTGASFEDEMGQFHVPVVQDLLFLMKVGW